MGNISIERGVALLVDKTRCDGWGIVLQIVGRGDTAVVKQRKGEIIVLEAQHKIKYRSI